MGGCNKKEHIAVEVVAHVDVDDEQENLLVIVSKKFLRKVNTLSQSVTCILATNVMHVHCTNKKCKEKLWELDWGQWHSTGLGF